VSTFEEKIADPQSPSESTHHHHQEHLLQRFQGRRENKGNGKWETMPPKQRSEKSSLVPNVSLSELLSRLSLAASSNDYDRLLQVSNDLLKSSPNNVLAAKQKVIALIKLDKYKDALAFLEESTSLDKNEYVLEHGFCLYKLGRGEEAEKVLEQGSGRAIEHVRAQNVNSLMALLIPGISNGGLFSVDEIVFGASAIRRTD
jgi:tetratricopeptide (TPR) repeat protein